MGSKPGSATYHLRKLPSLGQVPSPLYLSFLIKGEGNDSVYLTGLLSTVSELIYCKHKIYVKCFDIISILYALAIIIIPMTKRTRYVPCF